MDFLNDLAQWSGGLRASATRPVYQMRMELEREMKRREIGEAFDQVVGLGQQLQDQGEAVAGEQQLKYFHALGQLGIDPEKLSRTQMLEKAAQGARNHYELSNIGNGLDMSPTRHSGGVTYNQFDTTTESILHMTDAVRGLGRIRNAEADLAEERAREVTRQLYSPKFSDAYKADIVNKNSVRNSSRVEAISPDGQRLWYDRIHNPDDTFSYKLARDQGTGSLIIEPKEYEDQDLFDSLFKANLKSPVTVMGKNVQKAYDMTTEQFQMARPGKPLPFEMPEMLEMVEKVNMGGNQSGSKAESQPRENASGYRSAEDVKAAYSSGKLTREQALSILQKDFGYQ